MPQLFNHKDKETQREMENIYQNLGGGGDMETATYDPNAIAQDLYAGTGTAAPTTTPDYIGQTYVDTTNLNVYLASETNGSYNWAFVGRGESTDFTSSTVASMFEWWKADSGIIKDGGDNVSQWTDTVSGHVLTMGTAADQPDWIASYENSNPALQFVNTNDNMSLDNPDTSNNWTYFIVVSIDQAYTSTKAIIDIGVNSDIRTVGSQNLSINNYTPYFGTYTSGNTFIATIHSNASYLKARKNNDAEVLVRASGYNTTHSRTRLAEFWSGGYNSQCHISEVMFYNADLTEENIQKVLAYLNNKYAIY